jgi:hypothetical protein
VEAPNRAVRQMQLDVSSRAIRQAGVDELGQAVRRPHAGERSGAVQQVQVRPDRVIRSGQQAPAPQVRLPARPLRDRRVIPPTQATPVRLRDT